MNSNNREGGGPWIVVAAVITAIIGPLMVWYVITEFGPNENEPDIQGTLEAILTGTPKNDFSPGTAEEPESLPFDEGDEQGFIIKSLDIDELLGAGNWYCLDEWPNGIGVRNIPSHLVVNNPIIAVDRYEVRYQPNEIVPEGGPATIWLASDLPKSQCPSGSLQLDRDDLNSLLGEGNWYCLGEWPNGLGIRNVPSDFDISAPFMAVDKDGIRYDYGQAVPQGGPATFWLNSDLPQEQCP